MNNFCVRPAGKLTRNSLVIREGRYRGGIYHLLRLDTKKLQAKFNIPTQFSDPAFLEGANQRMSQGRMVQGPEMQAAFAKFGEFWQTGQVSLDKFLELHPDTLFISDATNAPFNEGHFAIADGKLLPLPPNSHPLSGKHYMLSTSNGLVSFPIVDLEDKASIQAAEEGFFVPKIIHEGQPIGLLDEIPGTGQISISDYRGHIGQMVKEAEYSEMNSQRRVDIHTQILEYLRNPRQYMAVLQNIISGQPVDFGQHGEIVFSFNTYNHTYWLETKAGTLYCLKTYASPDGSAAGVTFDDGPDLLFAIGRQHNLKINNAFLGTNGRDVRVVTADKGQAERITHSLDGTPLGDPRSFTRPSANFIAFLLK